MVRPKAQRPFFIVGVDRSGTTLLRVMLDRHPLLAIPPESHFIPRLWARHRRYGPNGIVDRKELFLRDLDADPHFRQWRLSLQAVRDELSKESSPTLAAAIECTFRAYAHSRGKVRWGDKTPGYAEQVDLLSRLFPEARFVHLIRDGRDVALSMMDLGRLHRRAATVAFFWRRRIGVAKSKGQLLGSRRYLELRYESLVEDPERELKRLCGFLDLSFAPEMLQHDERAVLTIPAAVRRMHRSTALPPTKGLRDWRSQMDSKQVAEFEAIAGQQLLATGYEVTSKIDLAVRARAWLQVGWFWVRSTRTRSRRRRRLRDRWRRSHAEWRPEGPLQQPD
jgi:hypothetical protein